MFSATRIASWFCLLILLSKNFIHTTPPSSSSSCASLDPSQIHDIFFKCVSVCVCLVLLVWACPDLTTLDWTTYLKGKWTPPAPQSLTSHQPPASFRLGQDLVNFPAHVGMSTGDVIVLPCPGDPRVESSRMELPCHMCPGVGTLFCCCLWRVLSKFCHLFK